MERGGEWHEKKKERKKKKKKRNRDGSLSSERPSRSRPRPSPAAAAKKKKKKKLCHRNATPPYLGGLRLEGLTGLAALGSLGVDLGGLRLEGLAGLALRGVLVELHLRALHDLARLAGLAALVGERGAGAGHGDQREESDGLGGHHCRRF